MPPSPQTRIPGRPGCDTETPSPRVARQLHPVVVSPLPRRQLEIDDRALALPLQQQIQLAAQTQPLMRQPNPEPPIPALPAILPQPPPQLQPLDHVLRAHRLPHLPRRLRRPRQYPMIVHHPRTIRPLLQIRPHPAGTDRTPTYPSNRPRNPESPAPAPTDSRSPPAPATPAPAAGSDSTAQKTR